MSEDVKYTRDSVSAGVLHTWITELRGKVEECDDEFLVSDLEDILDEMADFIGAPRE